MFVSITQVRGKLYRIIRTHFTDSFDQRTQLDLKTLLLGLYEFEIDRYRDSTGKFKQHVENLSNLTKT